MARNPRQHRSWFRKVARQMRAGRREFPRPEHGLYPELYFREKLVQERIRAERSNKPLLVMVLDAHGSVPDDGRLTDTLGDGVATCVRGTDVCGRVEGGGAVAVILTEVEPDKVEQARQSVARKTRERLVAVLGRELADRVRISFHTYPDSGEGPFDMSFYPEVTAVTAAKVGGDLMKRSLDLAGSVAGLVLFSPFFLVLPILIKCSSKGPVFFRQERVGRDGRRFKFLKFRSMYLDNDDVIHREYVKQLIRGEIGGEGEVVYKIQGDPRVTPLGRFIRKYSLDELPQFLNVLKGDMSLVGPRPPIGYEVEHYLVWQRNRLVGRRPGITGLWQVTGRSSTSFDDMVRLDLRYLRGWSILLDLRILLATPGAVIKGKGAY